MNTLRLSSTSCRLEERRCSILGVINSTQVSGPTTGSQMVNFSRVNLRSQLVPLRTDEVAHVKLLRNALGSAAVKKPAINLDARCGFANANDFLKAQQAVRGCGNQRLPGSCTGHHEQGLPLNGGGNSSHRSATLRSGSAGMHLVRCYQPGGRFARYSAHSIEPLQCGRECPIHSTNHYPSPKLIVYGGGSHFGGFYPDGMVHR